jgi:hypothetical protein
MTRIQQWRHIATSFHRIAHQVAKGNLPADFEPEDLTRLPERVPLSGAEQGVLSFLLHIWDHTENPFDLTETQRWDEDHLAAFGRWVTDPEEPCRYF